MARKGKRGASRYRVARHAHPDGTVLDSKRELKRYDDLRLLQMAGEIVGLEVHPRIPIEIGGVKILMRSARYPNGRQMVYVGDFRYYEKATGLQVLEDVKMQSGHRTEVYKIKRALVEAMGLRITEY